MLDRPRIAVFASGDGSNFEALVAASRDGRLVADIVGLVANRAEIGALERARRLQVPFAVVNSKEHTAEAWDQAVLLILRRWGAEWVALAGFLSLIGPQILNAYPDRIVNVHPALLPKFGGPGMYGMRVHKAVLAAGAKESGITIHLVNAEYDRGRILAQAKVAVAEMRDPEVLAAAVRALEHEHYPRVLNDLVWGRLTKP